MESNTNAVILLVDDQPDNTDTMMGYLSDSDLKYKYLQALNGEIACKVADKRLPDLIIMDWEMPVMNGYEALIQLKENPRTKDIPVVMATGRSSGGDLEKALNAGAADYIRKPIEKLELLARVRTCLSLSRYIKEINQKNEHLSDLNREKDGMVGIVAHDLKSPLNNIEGFSTLLTLEGELNEKQTEHLNKLKKQIKSCKALIMDLLDINAYEHAESEIKNEAFEMNAYLDNFVLNYESEFRRKNQTVELLSKQEHITINTDKTLLGRILDNLISNAIKFSNNGKKITLKTWEENQQLCISVKDEGPGISSDDQKKMFKMFQKLSAVPTGGESSNGLGLSIIKTLAKKLDGTIRVESKIGIGTEFIVSLPA